MCANILDTSPFTHWVWKHHLGKFGQHFAMNLRVQHIWVDIFTNNLTFTSSVSKFVKFIDVSLEIKATTRNYEIHKL